jgi:hypothetical protein
VGLDQLFDLLGGDVLAPPADGVGQPAEKAQPAVGVQLAAVARLEPATAERLRGRLRQPVVAVHDESRLAAADQDLARPGLDAELERVEDAPTAPLALRLVERVVDGDARVRRPRRPRTRRA